MRRIFPPAIRWFLSILIFLSAHCARQGAIPNPDRFPPHLESISSVNRTQLELVFDESLDANALQPTTFSITSAHDSANIRFLAISPRNPRAVLVITSRLIDEKYTVSGLATDKLGNSSLISESFTPSTREDTFPPFVTVSPTEPLVRFPYRLSYDFSEPADTSRGISILTVPRRAEEEMKREWRRDLMQYNIIYSDSLLKNIALYTLLLPGITDFSGNRVLTGKTILTYNDTTLTLRDVRGSVKTRDAKPAPLALILFTADDTAFAACMADSTGAFLLSLEDKTGVKIEAWFDAEQDGLYEETGERLYRTLPDSLIVHTNPTTPLRLQDIIHSP